MVIKLTVIVQVISTVLKTNCIVGESLWGVGGGGSLIRWGKKDFWTRNPPGVHILWRS
jgi:hypothetical protein